MKSCCGFKKSCWLPVSRDDPSETYCRGCLSLQDANVFEVWSSAPTAEGFFTAPVQRHILKEGNTVTLDKALDTLISNTLFKKILPQILTTPPLYSLLLLRFGSHPTPTDATRPLCKAYLTCLLRGYGDTLVFPGSCLYCLTAKMNYARGAAARQPFLWLTRQQFYSAARSVLLWNPNAIPILLELYATFCSIYYMSDSIEELLWQNVFQKAGRPRAEYDRFLRALHYHPLVLAKEKNETLLNSIEFREFLKSRAIPLAQELAMVAWHPDRFYDWCLDEEEKKEMAARWS
jgi:hypothetical protein